MIGKGLSPTERVGLHKETRPALNGAMRHAMLVATPSRGQ